MAESTIPSDISSWLMIGVIALVGIWLVMFVVRKLIAVVLVAGIVIGGWMVWRDPTVLYTAQDAALGYYDGWRTGAPHERDGRF